jgi:hypothetical protein
LEANNDFLSFVSRLYLGKCAVFHVVEHAGLEPATSTLPVFLPFGVFAVVKY